MVAGEEIGDPSGTSIAGGKIRAEVIHLVPVRHQFGTIYDFVEKKVVPEYEYEINEISLGTTTLTSAIDGTFHLSVAVPVATDGYQVILTTTDPEGRRIRTTVYAAEPAETNSGEQRPYLEVRGGGCGSAPRLVSSLDQPVDMTMHDSGGGVASGRFLFLVDAPGALEVTVQDAATLTRVLRDADLPGFTVRAVWLSSRGYSVADVTAVVDPHDKAITIGLHPDRARYQPGDPVTLAVTTADRAGNPIAADVVIRGVDEKLFTLGFARDTDPLNDLLAMPDPGFGGAYRSHAVPNRLDGGCGDAGGDGGGRYNFRDTVTFQRILTDAAGNGSATFELSDDLTSWHISAVAVSSGLGAGDAAILIPVGLPFFVDAILAPEYLIGERAVMRIRAYGGALTAGDQVRFTVSAPSLGLAPTTIEGTAFETFRVPLPAMTAGDHAIRIEGDAQVGGTPHHDALIRTIHVTNSRLGTLVTSYDVLEPGFVPQGGDGLTSYLITDAGRGRFIALLESLAFSTSSRFDRTAAAELARQLLIREFDVPATSLPATGYDAMRYQRGGIALLPYSSVDAFLSARAALTAGSLIGSEDLRWALEGWADGDDGATPEQMLASLAGLAGLGQDVLDRLRAYDPASLSIREQLWLGLGLAASGDEQGARAIERGLLRAYGERLGPWVRLAVGATLDNSLDASAMLLLLAARVGDPLASDVAKYLDDHPSRNLVFPLEQVAYAEAALERLPRAAARFAWTLAGDRHVVQLPPGDSYSLVLTSSQRSSLTLERLEGQLAVVTTWTSSNPTLPSSGGVTVKRTVSPAGDAPEDRLVRVTLEVTFGTQPIIGCFLLTDLLPSGLAPIAANAGWPEDLDEPVGIRPFEVEGQRVAWCATPRSSNGGGGSLYTYAARVVSPGTYRWEPAVIQSEVVQTVGASTTETSYTIR